MGGLAEGLEVLRAFSRDKPHMTLSEVAARAGLPPATARRCLNTFEELGYVMRSGRQFLLRPKVLEIGAAYLESMDIEALTQRTWKRWRVKLATPQPCPCSMTWRSSMWRVHRYALSFAWKRMSAVASRPMPPRWVVCCSPDWVLSACTGIRRMPR